MQNGGFAGDLHSLQPPSCRMPPTGRKLDGAWQHFERSEHKTGYQGTCNFCGEKMQGKVETLLQHLYQHSVEAKESALQQLQGRHSEQQTVARPNPGVPEVAPQAPPAKRVKQTCFEVKCYPKVKQDEQEMIDAQLTRMIAAANLPFCIVENVEFVKFCELLRGPTIRLPTRQRISDVLLPALHSEMKGSLNNSLTGKNGTLQMDGWSTTQNDPTIGFSVSVDGCSHFVDLHDTAGEPHTIENPCPEGCHYDPAVEVGM